MRRLILTLALAVAGAFLGLTDRASADEFNDNWNVRFGASKSYASEAPAKRSRRARSNNSERPSRVARGYNKRGGTYSGSGGGGGGSTGIASYYWQPQRVASGGWFNPNALTAAHKTLPFGTRVRVTNISNGRSVEVTINDRGPYVAGRVIDLSKAAAGVIGMQGAGLANVRMEVVGK